MAYPTTATLVAASTVDALTNLTTAQQDSLRDAAISAVEEFCQQSFDEFTALAKTLDGSGSKFIHLPARLATLTTLAVTNSSLDASDVALDDDKGRMHVKPDAVPGNYYTRALRDDTPPIFTLGFGTVVITGTWGWTSAEFPGSVSSAIRKDMEDQALADASELGDTVRGFRSLGVRDVSQGNLTVAIGGAPGLSERVVRLLEPYIWPYPAGALV